MSGLFSRPKIPTPPPTPSPEPKPEPVIEREPLEEDIRRRRAKLSRPKTIIAGDLTPETGKKGALG